MPDEVEELRKQLAELQEIALRVKEGQLEVWPDASMTSMGRAYRELRQEHEQMRSQIKALIDRVDGLARHLDLGGQLFASSIVTELTKIHRGTHVVVKIVE